MSTHDNTVACVSFKSLSCWESTRVFLRADISYHELRDLQRRAWQSIAPRYEWYIDLAACGVSCRYCGVHPVAPHYVHDISFLDDRPRVTPATGSLLSFVLRALRRDILYGRAGARRAHHD